MGRTLRAGKLVIIMMRSADSELLPCSHTCFNQLVLPDYPSMAKMKRKLKLAVNNYEGFGME